MCIPRETTSDDERTPLRAFARSDCRIPAKPEYITLCRLALTGISRLRPLGDETLADLKLALTEACSNSVRHAYATATARSRSATSCTTTGS